MSTGIMPRKLKKRETSADDANDKACNDEETQKTLQDIDNCQNEIDMLNEKASEEILKVEQKYNKLRAPFFEKRNGLISNIPNFWITCKQFLNQPDLSAIINDSEEDCLHHMKKLQVEEFEDIKSGFQIQFFFDENPYFENDLLTKDFHFDLIGNHTSQSTIIKWKEGFNLSQNSPKLSKSSRKRSAEDKSFFSWFNDNSDPPSDEIAEIIKDDLWQNPLQYFLLPDIAPDNSLDEDEVSEGNEDEEAETDERDEAAQKQDNDEASTV